MRAPRRPGRRGSAAAGGAFVAARIGGFSPESAALTTAAPVPLRARRAMLPGFTALTEAQGTMTRTLAVTATLLAACGAHPAVCAGDTETSRVMGSIAIAAGPPPRDGP